MAPDVLKNKIKPKFNCNSTKSHRKKINKNPKPWLLLNWVFQRHKLQTDASESIVCVKVQWIGSSLFWKSLCYVFFKTKPMGQYCDSHVRGCLLLPIHHKPAGWNEASNDMLLLTILCVKFLQDTAAFQSWATCNIVLFYLPDGFLRTEKGWKTPKIYCNPTDSLFTSGNHCQPNRA